MFHLVPAPVKMEIVDSSKETSFSKLIYAAGPVSANGMADFSRFLKKIGLATCPGEEANLIFHQADLPAEGYRLQVGDKIEVFYSDQGGALYALQTLKQLLLQGKGKLPALVIEDYPHYAYRGFMLDVGRYFYSVDEVKTFLERMLLHKLNVFHFHLTEDQGWRIEIKKYPLLTEKGSKRSHTNFGCKPHGGFYTQAQIREIVDYAHSFNIKVIPEFDIPGHTMSAIACYPELGCFGRQLKVKTHWGVKHDILCAGKERTYRFVYDILDELMDLFPDKVIHLGGDEAVKMRWEICPDCQKAIKENHLNDCEELQQYFMSKINAYLEKHGYSSMMWNWDSIQPTEHLDPAIAWNLCGVDEAHHKSLLEEMEKGRKMVNTSTFPYYLDFPYGWVNLKMAADFDPDAYLEHKNMIGIEAPLWTEYVPNMKKADYQTYPRLGAVATTAWSPKEERGYAKFLPKLEAYYQLLDCYQIAYASLEQANPSLISGKCGSLWFNRRQLHWEGIHNLVEDVVVKMKYGKSEK